MIIKKTPRTLLIPRRKFITGAAALIGYAALPAEARLGVTQLTGFGAGGAEDEGVSITLVANEVDATDATTFTFSDVPFGAPNANRKIVVVAVGEDVNTISAISMGGVGGSSVIETSSGGAAPVRVFIYQADVPTGLTGDIVVTWDGSAAHCGIGVWRITGCGTGPSAAEDTGTSFGAHPLTASMNVSAGGVILAAASSNNSDTYTWAGTTESYDETVEGGQTHSGSHDLFAAAQSGLTVSATLSGSGGGREAYSAASWAPA